MSTESVTAIDLIEEAVGAGVMPGAVLAAGRRGAEPLMMHVVGDAQHDGAAQRPMAAGTVFDLASLTKVVATLPCLLHLAGRGELAAAVAGGRLDDLVQEVVCAPLSMQATRYLPPREWAGRIAATEAVCGAAKVGVVHDENAEALGGVAGHAGLFGTAAD